MRRKGEEVVQHDVILDKNKILHDLDKIIACYRQVNSQNEECFYAEVLQIITQIEAFDELRLAQQRPEKETTLLVQEIISKLKSIPVVGETSFPSNVSELLYDNYLNTLKKFCDKPIFWFAS